MTPPQVQTPPSNKAEPCGWESRFSPDLRPSKWSGRPKGHRSFQHHDSQGLDAAQGLKKSSVATRKGSPGMATA